MERVPNRSSGVEKGFFSGGNESNEGVMLQTFPYRFISIITYLDPAPQYATHPAPAIYL